MLKKDLITDSKVVYNFMKILITGGLGFIGSNLAKRLVEDGNEVIIIDNLMKNYGGNLHNISNFSKNITLHSCDIRDIRSIKKVLHKIDIIFNLASQIGHSFSMAKPIEDLGKFYRYELK